MSSVVSHLDASTSRWVSKMAGGWTRDGAIQDQIDDTVTDAVLFARSRLLGGESETHCQECGEEIPEARRQALAVAIGPRFPTWQSPQLQTPGPRGIAAPEAESSHA